MRYKKPSIRPIVSVDSPVCTRNFDGKIEVKCDPNEPTCGYIISIVCGTKDFTAIHNRFEIDDPENTLPKIEIKDKSLKMTENFNYRKECEGEGGLLFEKETWALLNINEYGCKILELINEEKKLDEICEEIGNLYNINKNEIIKDIEEFLVITKLIKLTTDKS